jgi:hypothetical protein
MNAALTSQNSAHIPHTLGMTLYSSICQGLLGAEEGSAHTSPDSVFLISEFFFLEAILECDFESDSFVVVVVVLQY